MNRRKDQISRNGTPSPRAQDNKSPKKTYEDLKLPKFTITLLKSDKKNQEKSVLPDVNSAKAKTLVAKILDDLFSKEQVKQLSSDLAYLKYIEKAKPIELPNGKAIRLLREQYALKDGSYGDLTMSELTQKNPNLAKQIRDYANHHGINLYDILPKGEERRGRPPAEPSIDSTRLDPRDPVHALALKGLKAEAASREGSRRYYANKKARTAPHP